MKSMTLLLPYKFSYSVISWLSFFISYADPSDHYLDWEKQPFNVLVIKKVMDSEVTRCFKELTKWLIEVSLWSPSSLTFSIHEYTLSHNGVLSNLIGLLSPVACSQTLYFLFKVRRASVIRYKSPCSRARQCFPKERKER